MSVVRGGAGPHSCLAADFPCQSGSMAPEVGVLSAARRPADGSRPSFRPDAGGPVQGVGAAGEQDLHVIARLGEKAQATQAVPLLEHGEADRGKLRLRRLGRGRQDRMVRPTARRATAPAAGSAAAPAVIAEPPGVRASVAQGPRHHLQRRPVHRIGDLVQNPVLRSPDQAVRQPQLTAHPNTHDRPRPENQGRESRLRTFGDCAKPSRGKRVGLGQTR
ncbi:hypothetical protein FBY14_103182 [Azospirillum brasilense]|nr:hypothetical protein FBY14_103182 [Azospirillum brasilense]